MDFSKLKQLMQGAGSAIQDAGSAVAGWKESLDRQADEARESMARESVMFGRPKDYQPTEEELAAARKMISQAESMGTGAVGSVKMLGAGENAAQMLMRKAAEEAGQGVKVAGRGKTAAEMIRDSQAAKAAEPVIPKKTAAELYRDAKASGKSVMNIDEMRANPVKEPMNMNKLQEEAGGLVDDVSEKLKFRRLQELMELNKLKGK